ncbi:hypothetical protein HBI23_258440, partial [Parastagonospora nodorum]
MTSSGGVNKRMPQQSAVPQAALRGVVTTSDDTRLNAEARSTEERVTPLMDFVKFNSFKPDGYSAIINQYHQAG